MPSGVRPTGLRFAAGFDLEIMEHVGAVTPPTNVGLRSFSASRTWLTFTLLHMIGKCPILLHLLHRVSATGQFLLPGGCRRLQ